MSDGRVEIDVEVNGKDVKVLNSNLDQLEGKSRSAGATIKNLAVSMGLVKVASAAFNRIRQKSPILYRWVMNAVWYEGYRW